MSATDVTNLFYFNIEAKMTTFFKWFSAKSKIIQNHNIEDISEDTLQLYNNFRYLLFFKKMKKGES